MRDDSALYTGVTSATFGTIKEQKAERQRVKTERRAKLLPVGEIVCTEIQKEIDQIKNIDYLNVEEMLTDEHFKAELMARKKVLERLIALKNRFNTLLREGNHE